MKNGNARKREALAQPAVEEARKGAEQEGLGRVEKEYRMWKKPEKVKNRQRHIYTDGYSIDQVYYQIKKVTDIIIEETENYLASCEVDGSDDSESDERGSDGSGSDESGSQSVNDDRGSEDGSDDSDGERGSQSVNDDSASSDNANNDDSDNDDSGSDDASSELNSHRSDSHPNSNDELSNSDNLLNEEDGSSFGYNSEEQEEIFEHLEKGGDMLQDTMAEPASETLKRLRR